MMASVLRDVYDRSECGLCYSEAAIQNCSKEKDGKWKYYTSLCVNVRNEEEKSVRTGVNEYICVDGWIPRCFRVYASHLFILPLSRKHSAEITVWKDTVLSDEWERDSGTMECHCYSCQEHFSHAPGSQDFPQPPRIALLS